MTNQEFEKIAKATREEYSKKYSKSNLPNGRLNFSKISGAAPLPYLVEIQTDSYKWFLEKGIDEVFREIFPVQTLGNTSIDYVSSRLEAPLYDPLQCKAADLTYSSKLRATLRLTDDSGVGESHLEPIVGDYQVEKLQDLIVSNALAKW